ncbi:VOC family protein [Alkalibacterium iburiense]|uniref:VOC family protein n=1 Tax=Alkalibacterium iburiense TaxID=290589 RepID=A0ABN0X836_9LACT
MLRTMHHVAIIASDYEKTKHFYASILELPIIQEVYREEKESYKCDLKIGNSQIELFSFPNPPERVNNPEARGLRHVCFGVDNIDQAVQWLKNKEVVCEEIRTDPVTGQKFTFFKDPDALPIELYEL